MPLSVVPCVSVLDQSLARSPFDFNWLICVPSHSGDSPRCRDVGSVAEASFAEDFLRTLGCAVLIFSFVDISCLSIDLV